MVSNVKTVAPVCASIHGPRGHRWVWVVREWMGVTDERMGQGTRALVGGGDSVGKVWVSRGVSPWETPSRLFLASARELCSVVGSTRACVLIVLDVAAASCSTRR